MGQAWENNAFVRPELGSKHIGCGYGFGFGYGAALKSFIRIVIATLIFSRDTARRNHRADQEVVRKEGQGSRGARSGRPWHAVGRTVGPLT